LSLLVLSLTILLPGAASIKEPSSKPSVETPNRKVSLHADHRHPERPI